MAWLDTASMETVTLRSGGREVWGPAGVLAQVSVGSLGVQVLCCASAQMRFLETHTQPRCSPVTSTSRSSISPQSTVRWCPHWGTPGVWGPLRTAAPKFRCLNSPPINTVAYFVNPTLCLHACRACGACVSPLGRPGTDAHECSCPLRW